MAARPPLQVAVPEAETDRPRFGRLALIALGCFAMGLVWPGLVGVALVQRPPGTMKSPEHETPPPSEPDPSAPREEASGTPARAALHVEPSSMGRETTRIDGVVIVSCRSAVGQSSTDCDTPKLTATLAAPIAKLASCDAAQGAVGVLSLGLELDFARSQVTRVKAGRSTTLPNDQAAKLVACAERGLVGTRIDGVEHAHSSYWAYYMVRFVPPGSGEDTGPEVIEASGQGTIGWQTAVVREEPSRQANIVARLLYGTRVDVSGRAGDWYRVNLDTKGSSGWVHRKALGL